MMFAYSFEKTANGDMMEYYQKNPDKYAAWKERRKKKEQLKGGKADGEADSKFNKKELKEGTEEELEHTKSKKVAKEIAKDHLKEHPKYYKYLEEVEEKLEKEGSAGRAANVVRGLEHAGLMALQGPSWYDVHKNWGDKSKKAKTEKWKAGAEIGGLTALQGAVEAAHEGSGFNKFLKKTKKSLKRIKR